MAWADITDTETEAGKPAKASVIRRLRDNLLAAFLGTDPSAPKLKSGAYDPTPEAGDFEAWSHKFIFKEDTSGSLWKVASCVAKESGVYRCVISARAGTSVSGNVRIYKNGAAFGASRTLSTSLNTWTEDLSFSAGDKIEFYVSSDFESFVFSVAALFSVRTAAPINLVQGDPVFLFDAVEYYSGV